MTFTMPRGILEDYPYQFHPMIPNHIAPDNPDEDIPMSADRLAMTLILMRESGCSEGEFNDVNDLLTSGLIANGVIRWIAEISKYDEDVEE